MINCWKTLFLLKQITFISLVVTEFATDLLAILPNLLDIIKNNLESRMYLHNCLNKFILSYIIIQGIKFI